MILDRKPPLSVLYFWRRSSKVYSIVYTQKSPKSQLSMDYVTSDHPGETLMSAKAKAIVRAASKVFLSRGFAAATVDEIAACAGVSKRTIYKHFEGKEALFGLIIVQTSEQLKLTLDTSLQKGRDPRETLTELARDYLKLILSPQALDIYRLVISESARFPDLAKEIGRASVGRGCG